MNIYYFEGSARLAGALGVTYSFNAEVEAENKETAILKLYETWEHISISKVSAWNDKRESIPAE